ncbi:MAG: Fic family protein [Rhodospirillales bacterium]
MSTPNEKLAVSLEALKRLQDAGRNVFESPEFKRADRERLAKNGFLRDIVKGWVMSSMPDMREGDSTLWHASFWEFCALYSRKRFGAEWCLSPEQSIFLQTENTVTPDQVIVYTPKGANNSISLPFETSLYDLAQNSTPPKTDIVEKNGLRLYALPAALIKVSEDFYRLHSVEAEIALASITDTGDLLRRLLAGGHSAVAGRLAGALRRIGRGGAADDIIAAMKAADYAVRESDPFEPGRRFAETARAAAPIVVRLNALWESQRETVINAFPKPPGPPGDGKKYLKGVEDIYIRDAYNSLSIEGYQVSPELVERVRTGAWNPENNDTDSKDRSALAAKGYWQAFQLVKKEVEAVIGGAAPGGAVRRAHGDWYRELFQPSVAAGVIGPEVLAGHRNQPVYIKGSRHAPPRWEAVNEAVPALFDLMSHEPEPGVRAVLGHWLFGYIHPYPDGNGRIARFLMNVMLASGGYPWTVIRTEDRDTYLAALEAASVKTDLEPFSRFIAGCVRDS